MRAMKSALSVTNESESSLSRYIGIGGRKFLDNELLVDKEKI